MIKRIKCLGGQTKETAKSFEVLFEGSNYPINIQNNIQASYYEEVQNFKGQFEPEFTDEQLFSDIKNKKKDEVYQKYNKAKADIKLTIQVEGGLYLPPQQYSIDNLIELTQEKINSITNSQEQGTLLDSIEFTLDKEFIFRINGHKINLSKGALVKLREKMVAIRADLYNQQYDYILNIKNKASLLEVENIIIDFKKEEQYDLTYLIS